MPACARAAPRFGNTQGHNKFMLVVHHDLFRHVRLDARPAIQAGIDLMQERAVDGNFEISGDPFSVEEVPVVALRAQSAL